MASAVDKQPAAARLSAVAAAGRLPTATRGNQSSYTTLWDTTLKGWRQQTLNSAGWATINPAFDPEVHGELINPGNSLWIRLYNTLDDPEHGRYVGDTMTWICGRLFETTNLDLLLSSGGVFMSRGDAFIGKFKASYMAPLGNQIISGRVWYQGGLEVHPTYRGNRLGWFMANLIRVAGIHVFEANHGKGLSL